MKDIVVGLLGTGRIANNAHGPALARQVGQGVRVKYACDWIPGKAAKYKEKFPFVEQTVEDYRIMLADPEVDVIFVLTPNYEHAPLTIESLKAGKHVLCEKPVAVNYPLSLQMKEEADRQGRMLNIGVCNRFQKSVEILKEKNDKGEFGKIYSVYCSFRSFRNIPGLGGPFTDSKQSGGGVLIDWGVHFFDLIRYILGDPESESVTAEAYREIGKDMKKYRYSFMWAEDTADLEHGVNDVEDYITGFVRTSGASISFNGAWAQNIGKEEMFIDFLGDKAGARLDYGKLFHEWNAETLEEDDPEYEIPNMYYMEQKAFFESIRTGIKNKGNIDHVLETMRLLDGLYLSAKEHREISKKELLAL